MALTYSIRAAAEKTGISAHTIRAWERRYSVLNPERTDTNRRMYAEEDLERLRLLNRAVGAGHSIGMIASLSDEELARLALDEPALARTPGDPASYVRSGLEAMRNLDEPGFEAALSHAFAVLGVDAFLAEVVVPLIGEIDRGWEAGTLRIAHEHLASAVLRAQLERIRQTLRAKPGAPRIIVATPARQLHEIGALLVAIAAAREGWNVVYLGPNLPASEIAMAQRRLEAAAIALSIVYPDDDPELPAELRRLREAVGPTVAIFAGGRAAAAYAGVLMEIGASSVSEHASFQEAVERLQPTANWN
jgi:MerR family transcriptional regulator, light-induced transcriptional regulator